MMFQNGPGLGRRETGRCDLGTGTLAAEWSALPAQSRWDQGGTGEPWWTPRASKSVKPKESVFFLLTCSKKCSLDGYLTPHEVFVLLDLYTLDCWVNIRSVL